MTSEHMKPEVTEARWRLFLKQAEKGLDCAEDEGWITRDEYEDALSTLVLLGKCRPIFDRDAEQLPRLRLKRKHQRKAYRDLQRAYERVRGWWQDAALRNELSVSRPYLSNEVRVSGVYRNELSAEQVQRHTSENGTLVFDPNAEQPEDGA